MSDIKGIRSLDVVLEEVRGDRASQLQHFNSIDTKAGIVLGFAGALVALGSRQTQVLVDLGRGVAVISGFLSLSTFWPRRYWSTDLRTFRDKYLAAEPEFTRLRLFDTQVDMAERMAAILRNKAMRLKFAMVALAVAVLLTAMGLGVH